MLRLLAVSACLLFSGCSLLPEIAHQPTLHNPFPQLSKVAVAPFFNLSDEPTLNGEEVAEAYFTELQSVPGFEVVPVGVVKTAMLAHGIELAGPADARRLAQLLDVDAVVVGAVTDYTIYPPPRMGLRVEWYAANPGFHPIPPGYGLPWGTPEEEQIPDSLVLEAEFALAKEQLDTQTPSYKELAPLGAAPAGRGPAPAGPLGRTARRARATPPTGARASSRSPTREGRHPTKSRPQKPARPPHSLPPPAMRRSWPRSRASARRRWACRRTGPTRGGLFRTPPGWSHPPAGRAVPR